MAEPKSLTASYFEGIFAVDHDPWGLASSSYENDKHAATIAALDGRRYRRALEVGCAGGVLTRNLAQSCDELRAIDISPSALAQARRRCHDLLNLAFEEADFPRWSPDEAQFDLIVLSEVAYYWDSDDLEAAAERIRMMVQPGGDLILVHWTGATDYPQSGDMATEGLWRALAETLVEVAAARTAFYRLDLWRRR